MGGPGQNQAQRLLSAARAAETRGDWRTAAGAYAQLVRLDPSNTDALARFSLLVSDRFPGQVLEAAEHALAAGVDDVTLRLHAGNAARLMGRTAEAVEHLERALEHAPDDLRACLGLADIHLTAGRRDEAERLVLPRIERGERDCSLCVMFSRLAPGLGRADEALGLLADHAERSDLASGLAAAVWFRRADLLERLERYDEAFDAAERANALAGSRYNAAELDRQVESVIAAWTPQRVAALAQAGPIEPAPVLVTGMPRSGTSLTEAILSAHPEIVGLGEVPAVDRVVAQIVRDPRGIELLSDSAAVARLSGQLGDAYRDMAPGAGLVVDKLLTNFMHLGILSSVAPNARVVLVRRDPLDVGVSCFFSHMSGSADFCNDLANIAHFHGVLRRLMAHWQRVLDTPVLELWYKDLVGDFEAQVRRLLNFVGVGFDRACLRFHESEHATRTLSYEQVRRPIHRRSVGRWRRYAGRLGPLRAALGIAG